MFLNRKNAEMDKVVKFNKDFYNNSPISGGSAAIQRCIHFHTQIEVMGTVIHDLFALFLGHGCVSMAFGALGC